jgi:hypothetical protein
MWKLLKTEISYFRWLYILSLIFVAIINIGLTVDDRWIEAQGDFPGLRVIWLGVGIVVFFFSILFNRKSGRLRNQKLVPVSDIQISSSRIIVFVGFWICLLIILFCFYIFNFGHTPDQDWIVNLASTSGVMFLINSIPILYSDFYSTYFTKKDKFFIGTLWSIIWLVYIGLNILFSTYLDFLSPDFFINTRQTLTDVYFKSEVTLVFIFFGFGIFIASIYTFNKRKLFLE